jgi:glycosyltransferase involved in cell wall biosynthesis
MIDAEVYIVDSGSTDGTVKIAKEHGCSVLHNTWVNYATQFNWGLKNARIKTPWTMRMDADETITPELAKEINERVFTAPPEITGFSLKRRVYFWGRWIRHGGYYPTWLTRIWRTGTAHCEPRWMDEHMVIEPSNIQQLQHDIIDENHKGLSFWIDKHNGYADREVRDLIAIDDGHSTADKLPDQAGRKRWMKEHLYSNLPLFFRAWLYWFIRYFIQLGFLDGLPGMVFHFLQGFWYRFLVDAKLYESRKLK